MTDGNTLNLALKRTLEHFLEIPPPKKIPEFPDYKIRGIKPMIENLQDKLYQLEYKQAKDAKFCANIK